MRFDTLYDITEKVIIDGCKDLVAVITGVQASGVARNIIYRVEWVSGSNQTAWIEEWRLSKWEE